MHDEDAEATVGVGGVSIQYDITSAAPPSLSVYVCVCVFVCVLLEEQAVVTAAAEAIMVIYVWRKALVAGRHPVDSSRRPMLARRLRVP